MMIWLSKDMRPSHCSYTFRMKSTSYWLIFWTVGFHCSDGVEEKGSGARFRSGTGRHGAEGRRLGRRLRPHTQKLVFFLLSSLLTSHRVSKKLLNDKTRLEFFYLSPLSKIGFLFGGATYICRSKEERPVRCLFHKPNIFLAPDIGHRFKILP